MQPATVKWYSSHKKFGFVVLDDGREAMLHVSVIPKDFDAHKKLERGAVLEVEIKQINRGLRVESFNYIKPPDVVVEEGHNPLLFRGTVKWYDPSKGYGFILVGEPDQLQDAFIHATVIKRCGYECLQEGDTVMVTLEHQNGLKASSVKLV